MGLELSEHGALAHLLYADALRFVGGPKATNMIDSMATIPPNLHHVSIYIYRNIHTPNKLHGYHLPNIFFFITHNVGPP